MILRKVATNTRVFVLLSLIFFLGTYFFIQNYLTPVKATVSITESAILPASAHQRIDPTISGNYIVWEDDTDSDLYVYDISTKNSSKIATGSGYQKFPSIYGDKVIYLTCAAAESDACDIYMYDLSGKEETRITTSGNASWPRMQGNIIVWTDARNMAEPNANNYDIYSYNIISGIERQITTNVEAQMTPVIYGDIIAWTDLRNTDNDIYTFDLASSQETKITAAGDQLIPEIFGNKVAYQSEDQAGNLDIVVYDLGSQGFVEVEANSAGGAQMGVTFDGSRLVYDPTRDGAASLYMYDLSSKIETRITTSRFVELPLSTSISGNYIVWEDNRTGIADIYMATLVEQTVPVFENLPNGLSPINVTAGQLINTNPYVLKVKPTDASGIKKVEFSIDDILICTTTSADSSGIHSCSWDTSKYHSNIKVVATNNQDKTATISLNVIVDPSVYMKELPKTGGQ